MENLISRHRNLSILAVVLFAQIIGLAAQVRRPGDHGSVRLIRLWVVTTVTPVTEAVVDTKNWLGDTWRTYVAVRSVKRENERLKEEISRMRLEQVRMAEDASQARRLQTLLGFKEQYVSQTLPAQVISSTGSEFSRAIYIDKGTRDGVKPDMPVITPDGVVGKVFKVYPGSSLVLKINDPSSGIGVILEKSRLQGILKGTPNGASALHNIMTDEKVEVGERVLTSGGDRIFPKGLPVGQVASVSPGNDLFLNIRIRPNASLERVEEVLVITKVVEKAPEAGEAAGPIRAIDVLAQRLPSVPKPTVTAPTTGTPSATATPGAAANTSTGAASTAAKPNATARAPETASKPVAEAGKRNTTSVPAAQNRTEPPRAPEPEGPRL